MENFAAKMKLRSLELCDSILIVEDDPPLRRAIQRLLVNDGFATFSTHCVRNAKDLIGLYDFQILVTDYDLPDGTGGEIVQLAERRGIMRRCVLTSDPDRATRDPACAGSVVIDKRDMGALVAWAQSNE